MMAPAARRELGGRARQQSSFQKLRWGAYGIARFAEREPVDSDEHARSTCRVRDRRQPLVRRWE
jgi:hypothetical protein